MELLLVVGFLFIGFVALRSEIRSIKPKKKTTGKTVKVEGDEYVYILANPSYRSGFFKIGLTKREVDSRMRELFTTGVPTPFVKCVTLKTDDCKTLEKALHSKYANRRINSRREWFELTKSDIEEIIDSKGMYEVMSYDQIATQKALGASESLQLNQVG